MAAAKAGVAGAETAEAFPGRSVAFKTRLFIQPLRGYALARHFDEFLRSDSPTGSFR
jgi:hypothetical protein